MLPYLMNNADNNTISENDLARAYLYAANVHLMYLNCTPKVGRGKKLILFKQDPELHRALTV